MVARITIWHCKMGSKNMFCDIAAKRVSEQGCFQSYHPRFKPCKKSAGCCKLRIVVAEKSSSFCNRIFTCMFTFTAHFNGPMQTCFVATDVNPLYGVTQSNKSLFKQLIFLNMHLILSVSSCLFHISRSLDCYFFQIEFYDTLF